MPTSPKRPCRYPGCPGLAATGEQYCPQHKVQAERFYNKYQRPNDKNAYGRAWKRIRDRYIAAHPLCEQCKKDGRMTPAQEVHHILPLSKGGTHAEENLMALCTPCHSAITAKDGDRWHSR